MLIADEVPVDEARRDELLEDFQAQYHGGDGREVPEPSEDDREDDLDPDGEDDTEE